MYTVLFYYLPPCSSYHLSSMIRWWWWSVIEDESLKDLQDPEESADDTSLQTGYTAAKVIVE